MNSGPTYSTLTSYLPDLVLQRLASETADKRGPIADHRCGAVLIADVSGFTTITEQLAKRGAVGAEELTRLLNDYFGRVIDLIADHGGDIVRFAGDAILAVWPSGEDRDVRNATRSAAQCGLTLQQVLCGYCTDDGVELRIKIGIGTGDFTCMHLGGEFARWEVLITGLAFVQSFAALEQSRPGQVVVSLQAWADLQEGFQGTQLQMGSVLVISGPTGELPADRKLSHTPTDYPLEELVRAYVPGTVTSRLAVGHEQWIGELRVVSALFVNLPELNYATPLDRAQTIIQYLQRELYRFEGSINKLNLDDKGTSLLAALGLPPLAHEDDPRRAVHAALAIRQRLLELGLRSSIGVATGRVFCGSVGSQRRREYTLMGDVVNLAARLMQSALGDIHCDDATWRMSQTHVDFQRLADINIKGKNQQVSVHRPIEHKRAFRSHGRELVGRQKERETLRRQLEAMIGEGRDLKHGTSIGSSVVVIEGPPGIGKSGLVSEFLAHTQGEDIDCYVGSGDSIESSTLYYAWRPIIDQLLDIVSFPPTAEQRRAQILSQLKDRHPELLHLAPLLGNALSIDLPDNDQTRHMSGKVRGENTRQLLQQLVAAGAQRRPMVLVLEDTQWLDTASWTLLAHVIRSVSPLLTVITSRPVDREIEAYQAVCKSSAATHLMLGRLGRDETEKLLCTSLGVERVPPQLVSTIHAKADGNPLFTEHLIAVVRERTCRDGSDEVPIPNLGDFPVTEIDFPDTLHGVITSRIDRLDPSPQLAVKVASVIGRRFTYDALRDNYPVVEDRSRLRDFLGAGLQAGLIEVDIPEPPVTYRFQHVIAQEAAYHLLLFDQRQQLHRSIAQWYEANAQHDIETNYPIMAHHWENAGDAIRAVDFFEKAGETALRNGAYAEAVDFVQRAIQLDEPGESRSDELRRATWHRQLAEAQLGLGKLAASKQSLESSLQLIGRPSPSSPTRLLASLTGQVLKQVTRRLSPGQSLWLGQRDRASTAPQLESARCYERLAEIYYLSNDRERLVHAVLSMLNSAERAGPSPELARAYANSCFAAGLAGFHPLARSYANAGQATAQIVDDASATAWVLEATGIYYLGLGKCHQARTRFAAAIEICERIGDWQHWGETMAASAQACYYCGESELGLTTWRELFDKASSRGDDLQRAWGLNGQAEGLLRLGGKDRADRAARYLEEALGLLSQDEDRVSHFGSFGLMALAQLRRGEPIAARRAADAGLQLANELATPTGYYTLNGYYGVARTYLALWEANGSDGDPDLMKLAIRAGQYLHRYARVFPIGRPRDLLCQGLVQLLSGRKRRAMMTLHKGLAAAAHLQLPYVEELLRDELAAHYPDRGVRN